MCVGLSRDTTLATMPSAKQGLKDDSDNRTLITCSDCEDAVGAEKKVRAHGTRWWGAWMHGMSARRDQSPSLMTLVPPQ